MAHHILLVDDSSSMRTVMRTALERAGFSVDEAENGLRALDRLDGRAIHVIVCDLSMPELDGLEFLRRLRAHPVYRFTPAVMLSFENRDLRRAEARDAGASAWLSKPCPPSRLVDLVKRLCH